MSLFKIAWRSLQQRPLASTLTCVSMALGVALVVAVLVTHSLVNDYLTRNTALGYHLVVGGKNGSKIDLVLSTVYHIRKPDFPLPWSVYKKFITSFDEKGVPRTGEYAGSVLSAVPICLGDNVQGYRVIATTPNFFDLKYAGGKSYQFAAGERFKSSRYFDAVIGAEVARKTGMGVGSTFKPTHGVSDEPGATPHVHDDEFKIVGILERTGTPNDRVVIINIEGFYLVDGHAKEDEAAAASGEKKAPHKHAEGEHHHHAPLPESQREVTAVMVLCGSPVAPPGMNPEIMGSMYAEVLHRTLNKGNEAQADYPVRVVEELINRFVAPLGWLLFGLTALTVFVAGVGIMVSIYNSMTGRRHEIAVMRALGASRGKVMTIVLFESILLAVIGGVLGLILGHGIVWAINPLLIEKAGISVEFWRMSREEAFILPALLVLATLVGYIPALTAYRTDVVRGLSSNA